MKVQDSFARWTNDMKHNRTTKPSQKCAIFIVLVGSFTQILDNSGQNSSKNEKQTIYVSDTTLHDKYYIHEGLKSELNSGKILYFFILKLWCLLLSATNYFTFSFKNQDLHQLLSET